MAVSLMFAEIFLLVVSSISIIFGIINTIAVHNVDMKEMKERSANDDENEPFLDGHD